jgi:hypothetical protein
LEGNAQGQLRPHWLHLLSGFSRFFANGTSCNHIVARKFAEAVPMNGMPARHFMTGLARGKQILQANGATTLIFTGFAIVILKD